MTREPTPAPARGSFRLPAPREELRVRLDEFLHATGRPQTHAVVEALETEMHYGAIGF